MVTIDAASEELLVVTVVPKELIAPANDEEFVVTVVLVAEIDAAREALWLVTVVVNVATVVAIDAEFVVTVFDSEPIEELKDADAEKYEELNA